MPTVTALRGVRRERVAVDLDGAKWRTIPTEVAVLAGLAVGLELDRPRLRTLGRELRRSRALKTAGRALRFRDFSRTGLEARLQRSGIEPSGRREAISTLERAGLLDDSRAAATRARGLAERPHGDAAIREGLLREGFAERVVEEAISALEPETERARRLAAKRGASLRTAGYLARRGFCEESIETALGFAVADPP